MEDGSPRYAARCRYLQVTLARAPSEGLLNRCRHIVREGSRCVGPFLDDTETTCGLWESAGMQRPAAANA